MNIFIKPAVIEQAREISRLLNSLTKEFISKDCSEAGVKVLLNSMSEENIKMYVQSDFYYVVAKIDKEIVGVIALKSENHIYHLFVSRRVQSNGIATQLWQYLENHANKKFNPKYFTVNSSNNAVGLYEKFGFVAESEAQTKNGVSSIPMKLIYNQ
ncbi:MAG: hypothetical protein COA86_11940 [Kangiella sp.]|nr:MAG: hypothetical protein COA86_11940 [Kangiella sp.]